MGLFGGNSKTYYNTSTLPLYDENTPGMLKQTIMSATVTNRGIGSSLLENILNSNSARLEGLYRYGKSGAYQWGLPDQVEKHISQKAVENIDMTIEKEIGEPVRINYSTFDNIIIPSEDVGKEWTLPSTPNLPNAIPLPEDNLTIAAQGFDWYYLVEYSTVEEPTVYHQWRFRESDASINNYGYLQIENTLSNPYYPIIPFRVNQERWDNNPSYTRDIRRACHFLGLDSVKLGNDIQQLSDNNEADGNPNPIEEAYIFLGIPVNTDKQVGKQYLFEYFLEMYKTSAKTEGDYIQWENSAEQIETGNVPPRNSTTIKDVNFETTLSWSYIKRTVKEGNLQDSNGKSLRPGSFSIDFVEESRVNFNVNQYISGSVLSCKRQNKNNTYFELEVFGLGFSSLVVGKEMYYTLEEVFEPEDATQDAEKFVIPLHRTVLKKMGRIRGHDLMNIAIRMQINDKIRIKQKTNWFGIIVLIVSIVVTVLFPPAGGWTMSSAFAALGINIAVAIVMKFLSPVVTKVLQDVFGEKLGAVLAVMVQYFIARGMTAAITPASTPATVKPVGATPVDTMVVNTSSIVLTTMDQVNLALDVANAYQHAVFKEEMDNQLSILSEIEKEAMELQKLNDLVGYDGTSGIVIASQLQDTNQVLNTSLYVDSKMNEINRDSLLTLLTHEYTDAMRYTGRVYSPINNAKILN